MAASCFSILVNVGEVFNQFSAGLANVLLPAVIDTAGDCITDVPCVAVCGGGQLCLVYSGSVALKFL